MNEVLSPSFSVEQTAHRPANPAGPTSSSMGSESTQSNLLLQQIMRISHRRR